MHFTVKEDPKIRSLPRKLCQECAAIFSGIGVLYTVIQCFKVRVGAEAGVQILAVFFWQSFLCFLVSDQMFLLGETQFCSFFLYFFSKNGFPAFSFSIWIPYEVPKRKASRKRGHSLRFVAMTRFNNLLKMQWIRKKQLSPLNGAKFHFFFWHCSLSPIFFWIPNNPYSVQAKICR